MKKDKKRFYSIILCSDLTGKFRSFRIYKHILKTCLTIFIIITLSITGFSVFFIQQYIKMNKELVDLEDVLRENRLQKIEIERFAQKIRDFDVQMVRLEKFDKKLRIITALEDSGNPSLLKKWGMGGSDKWEMTEFSAALEKDSLRGIKKLYKDLEQLRLQANLREVSFQELDEFFKDQTSFLSSIPSIWPTRGWITSKFGYRNSPFTGLKEMHKGLDIATRMSSPIISPADGVVIRVTRNHGFGNMLEVDHGYGIITRYGHNSKHLLKVGDRVKRGQIIAMVGSTGRSTGPHLHYEVIVKGVQVNPLKYILEDES